MPAPALNKNNSAVKRIMQEARELANDPSTDYHAAPLEDDIFEWHCTIRGPSGTEFEGGIYHFRILLPAEYPFRPPSIMMLTPNGRFELNTKICISFTNYHEELWQPAWGVRTAIIGLQGFFPLKGQQAVGVGSIESHTNERKRLAALSREWTCPVCKTSNHEILPDPTTSNPSQSINSPAPPPPATAISTPEPTSESATPQREVSGDASLSQRPTESSGVSDTTISQNTAQNSVNTRPSESQNPPQVIETRSPAVISNPPVEFPQSGGARRSPQKPPVLLDTAIMILLVLVFAIICRRVV
ncbi:non-canonical ubiquitin conjugating enzyme 1 [Coprinopsis cinerea okayama7|uniref:Non-canonical ubiquitin conjugating enzyme 1 n=1 Tax=Coprinopsis cinerea (strain Okayama-7 / 130 / ATCC MYA-4618 / FGSC 9003) TaxID=240176 RepID=A8NGV5_COPC7|nr:non-canonical ubiquitin conjugating enzyme 1 [Coprinopsis cinerea okayama7\|eukprot:XP_001833610.2 non-canonical ubiquitin conjugating enzyme 1 [Coprinopsis cinerea okayama7\